MTSPQEVHASRFLRSLERLERARPVARVEVRPQVLDAARTLVQRPGGLEKLAELAPRFDAAGVFAGTDWDDPSVLVPQLVERTLACREPHTVVLECLSELRLLSIARGRARSEHVSPEQARRFLTHVLALNARRLFDTTSEADRVLLGPLAEPVGRLFRFVLEEIGFLDVVGSLIDEIWRILDQRPVQIDGVKAMVRHIAVLVERGGQDLGQAGLGADRLVSALFHPTRCCEDDPGVAVYGERLASLDDQAVRGEAHGFARAMHDTGLVSDYHVVLLRWLNDNDRREDLPAALGLSSTGTESLRTFYQLVQRLVAESVHVETAQSIYGLAMLLERGLLFEPPVAPGLWRQIELQLSPETEAALALGRAWSQPSRVHLLAGIVSLLGQPLGVGQGENPTCQSARALSMWALNDADYLLHLIAQAARTDSITMHFEGRALKSGELAAGLVAAHPLDTDPVSRLLVPHLDRIYAEMGRLCQGRGEDPHRWINPEFHGWWVGREFAIAVSVASGRLVDYDAFVRRFYGQYHPYHNGMSPVIHPQPAGLAITDSTGAFVGWHAITILRVALDQDDVMRVYFFNPNDDGGQNWGDEVVVSTRGNGERYGESSLPFEQLASRLYIFHFDSTVCSPSLDVPADVVRAVRAMATRTWASARLDPSAAAEGPAEERGAATGAD